MDNKTTGDLVLLVQVKAAVAQAARSSQLVEAFIKLDDKQQHHLITYAESLGQQQNDIRGRDTTSP